MANSRDETWAASPLVVKDASANSSVQSVNTRIGRGCHFKGSLELTGSSHIDGAVEGDILSSGELTISETGIVNGRVSTERVKVFGQVVGDITCAESLEFHTGARIKGDIKSPSVVIHDGVLFEGQCSMPAVDETGSADGNVFQMSSRTESAQDDYADDEGPV